MMVVFDVYLSPGADPEDLLSQETVRETKAQVMTVAEAAKVGFSGLPEAEMKTERRLIAVAKRDAPWIQRALETSPAAAGFRVHDVD